MSIKCTTVAPEMCECGRLYKDRRDKNGNMMCSACYTGLEIDDLKKLWSHPIPKEIKDLLRLNEMDQR